MPRAPDGSFQDTTSPFDPALNRILDRVYGSTGNADSSFESGYTEQREFFARREKETIGLQNALSELRDRRMHSQSVMRMREELTYLQDQIQRLRQLHARIEALSEQVAAPRDSRSRDSERFSRAA